MKKLFILLASFVVASCSKVTNDEITQAPDRQYDFAKDIHLIEKASNPNNPYDDFGKQHFMGVIDVMGRLRPNHNATDILQFSKEYGLSIDNGITKVVAGGVKERELTTAELKMIYDNAKNKYIFATDGIPSPQLQAKINEFSSTIESLSKNPNDFSYSHIYNRIATFENSVLADNKLAANDRAMILKATSTYRYSAAQWEAPINGLYLPNGSWENNAGTIIQFQQRKLKWFHWIIVGAADAAGALLGGGVGGAVAASTFTYSIIKDQLSKNKLKTSNAL